ncbi:hypothetical protein ACJX0J_007964, partial [Zea mays]
RPFCVLIDKHQNVPNYKKGRFLLTDNLMKKMLLHILIRKLGVAIKSIAQVLFCIGIVDNLRADIHTELSLEDLFWIMMMLSCYAIKENKHIIFYKRNYADLVIWNYLSHICASITSLLLQHKFTILRFMYMYCFPSNRFTANYLYCATGPTRLDPFILGNCRLFGLHLGTMQQIMNKKVRLSLKGKSRSAIYFARLYLFKYFTETWWQSF